MAAIRVETVRQLLMRGLIATCLILSVGSFCSQLPCFAQGATSRRIKTKTAPDYPEIARRMGISGTVRLAIVIAPNGSVKTTSPVGGHPLLLNAAMDAVKKWKFESASETSTETVEIKFVPQN
ncbi:MAG: energy transducer TonB [Terriglobales bacterium]|jgi:protein TonB|nr:energy transducer TonB [Terriglobales bacterium]